MVKATCAGLNSSFSALNTAHTFSTTRKPFGKKAALKRQAREFFIRFVVKFFNSSASKDCFSQCSVFIHDLESHQDAVFGQRPDGHTISLLILSRQFQMAVACLLLGLFASNLGILKSLDCTL